MKTPSLTLAALPLLLAACGEPPPSAPIPGVPEAALEEPGPLTMVAATPASSTTPAPPGAPLVVAIPMPVTGPVDGLYYGKTWLTRGQPYQTVPTDAQMPQLLAAAQKPFGCPPDYNGILEVGDGTVMFPYLPDTVFIAPVPQNGRLHAVAGSYVMNGTLTGGDLTLAVTSPNCESVMSFRRVPYY